MFPPQNGSISTQISEGTGSGTCKNDLQDESQTREGRRFHHRFVKTWQHVAFPADATEEAATSFTVSSSFASYPLMNAVAPLLAKPFSLLPLWAFNFHFGLCTSWIQKRSTELWSLSVSQNFADAAFAGIRYISITASFHWEYLNQPPAALRQKWGVKLHTPGNAMTVLRTAGAFSFLEPFFGECQSC